MRFKNLYSKAIIIGIFIVLIACLFACSKNDNLNFEIASSTAQVENSTEMIFKTRTEKITSGTCGNRASWSFDTNTNTLTISGSGDIELHYPGWNPWIAQIENISIGEEITGICDDAFRDCINLKSIYIPEKITRIGNNAFYGCKNLDVITIENNIKYLGYDVFTGTAYYEDDFHWHNKVLYIDSYLFAIRKDLSGNYTIQNETKGVAAKAFYSCNNLNGITIPNNVWVGENAFGNCQNLRKVSIGNDVKLYKEPFSNCPNIEILDIPNTDYLAYFEETKYYKNNREIIDGVTYIGNYIVEVDDDYSGKCTIKEGTKSINSYLFLNSKFTEIHLPSSLEKIEEFYGGGSATHSLGYNLESICVDEKNMYFSSDDGVLYDKEKTYIYIYPEQKKTKSL